MFAPTLFVGGMVGAAMWILISPLIPGFAVSPAAFCIVGMMACFGGAGKVPIAVILMVAEMTASYTLLVPAIVATTVAYIVSGRDALYKNQVPTRAESPAHRAEHSVVVLSRLKVNDCMIKDVITITPERSVGEALELMAENEVHGIPVVGPMGELVGVLTHVDVLELDPCVRYESKIEDVMTRKLIVTHPDDKLQDAFQKMMFHGIGRLPVVDPEFPSHLLGIISRTDIGKAYDKEIRILLEENSTEAQ